jgi:hypothetical protein
MNKTMHSHKNRRWSNMLPILASCFLVLGGCHYGSNAPPTGAPSPTWSCGGTINFGAVNTGSKFTKECVLRNRGNADLVINTAIYKQEENSTKQDFTLDTKLPVTLKAGDTTGITFRVTYAPSGTSPKKAWGSFVLDTSWQKLRLHALGQATEPPIQTAPSKCKLTVLPQRLDFGSVQFGCTTSKRQLEVFHPGSSKCTSPILVTKIGLANNKDNEFRIIGAPTTPVSINTGQSIRIELSYNAKNLGADIAMLNIETNSAGRNPITLPLEGEGRLRMSDQKDTFRQLKRPIADVLIVIDNSSSMGTRQANLAKNFSYFMNWIVRLNVDYHIAVITTDTSQTGTRAPGCIRGRMYKVVTQKIPNPIATFAQNVKVGTGGSGVEKGLEAAYQAFQPKALAGCNNGFYRKNAALSIIFVSDEPDQSPRTVDFYVSFFKALKGIRNLDLIRATAVVGPPPSGCRNPGTGNASSAPRYWEVAKQLKGVKESSCISNWAYSLFHTSAIGFGYRTQFFLSRQAEPKTIRVKVNGRPIKQDPQDGWTYNSANSFIQFTKSQIPEPAATIEVEYQAVCLR